VWARLLRTTSRYPATLPARSESQSTVTASRGHISFQPITSVRRALPILTYEREEEEGSAEPHCFGALSVCAACFHNPALRPRGRDPETGRCLLGESTHDAGAR
jgi:hypothetical protein